MSEVIKGRPSLISDLTTFFFLELCPCIIFLEAGPMDTFYYFIILIWELSVIEWKSKE
jgi:hypothetical protein